MTIAFAAVLGVLWGIIWALALSTPLGRFLARRLTWLTVVIGIGVDLLIMLIVLPLEQWLAICAIVASSSIGIIGRSLVNQWRDHLELMEAADGHPHPDR